MKALFYCTKGKPYLYKNTTVVGENIFTFAPFIPNESDIINGKIVAECDFEVEKMLLKPGPLSLGIDGLYYVCEKSKLSGKDGTLNEKCQLTNRELVDYLVFDGYAIHIKNLHIFDEPKELKDFEKILRRYEFESERCDFCSKDSCENCRCHYLLVDLEKAPQNMMYVFDGEEKKVLISIRPEWLCKILNGEKKIEVRKKVLKEMIK